MLDPRNEKSWEGLFEVFQPPEGYRLAAAFGTTFGLSLDALVAALLAMGECDPDTMAGDAVAQVMAVTRLSSKVRILTHSGTISGGAEAYRSQAVVLLDRLILETSPPAGLFHPKVWALRFERIGFARAGLPDSRGRLVVSSLNLGSSRSFEVGVVVDGEPGGPGEGAPFSRDIASAIEEWIRLAAKPVPPAIRDLPAYVRQLILEPPREAELGFRLRWNGESQRRLESRIPSRMRRAIVVAPFIQPDFARQVAERSEAVQFVSNREALDALPDELIEELQRRRSKSGPPILYQVAELGGAEGPAIAGVHAKLLLAEEPTGRSVTFLGSANATGPGWGLTTSGNVEAMAEMHPGIGIDSFTRDFIRPSGNEVHPWISEYDRSLKSEPDAVVEAEKRLLRILRQAGNQELALDYRAESGILELSMQPVRRELSERAGTVEVAPLRLGDGEAAWVTLGDLLKGPRLYEGVTIHEVTGFVAMRVVSAEPPVQCQRIVLANLRLSDEQLNGRDDAVRGAIMEGADPTAVLNALVYGLSRYRGGNEAPARSRAREPQSLRRVLEGAGLEGLLQSVALQPALVQEIRLLLGSLGGPFRQLCDDLEKALATVSGEANH